MSQVDESKRRLIGAGVLGFGLGALATAGAQAPQETFELIPSRDKLTIAVWLSGISKRQEEHLCHFMDLVQEQPDDYELVVVQVFGGGMRQAFTPGHTYPCLARLGEQEFDFFGRHAERIGLRDIPGVVLATEGWARMGPLDRGKDLLAFAQGELGLR